MALEVKLFDLVMAFSRMLDQVMPALAGHHMRVGFFADRLAVKLHFSPEDRQTVFVASMLHDVGALPLQVGVSDLVFEKDLELHAKAGQYMLQDCPPLRDLAEPVRYHHTRWNKASSGSRNMHLGCLIGLADRVDIALRPVEKNASTVEELVKYLRLNSGDLFAPSHVEAMCAILDETYLRTCLRQHVIPLPSCDTTSGFMKSQDVKEFSILFGHIIDLCSPFTATHSTGVAYTASALGRLAGMTQADLDTLFVAGMLHDIGKLGVPPSLLEKPGPLTAEELPGMKHHAFLSGQWLDAIPGFEQVSPWGALHHERLNGTGYPHGLHAVDLCLESRIMAVADVFTAITEDRPYRAGMTLRQALDLIDSMQTKGGLDLDLVGLLAENVEEINQLRIDEQEKTRQFFIRTKEVCQA